MDQSSHLCPLCRLQSSWKSDKKPSGQSLNQKSGKHISRVGSLIFAMFSSLFTVGLFDLYETLDIPQSTRNDGYSPASCWDPGHRQRCAGCYD